MKSWRRVRKKVYTSIHLDSNVIKSANSIYVIINILYIYIYIYNHTAYFNANVRSNHIFFCKVHIVMAVRKIIVIELRL